VTDELLREIRCLHGKLDQLAAEMAAVRLAVGGKPYRDALLRELAAALALGGTWAAAQAIELVLRGIRPAPAGAEAAVAALGGVRLSARQVLRILQAGDAAAAADKGAALCQSWMARHDDRSFTHGADHAEP
jgi:hypothetical protein